jgi:hypothetical protein
MKLWLATFGLSLLFAPAVFAQDSYGNASYDQLRDDYNASSMVLRVAVKNTSPLTDQNDYYQCVAHGKPVDAFKGGIHKGKPVDFFVPAKAGCDTNVHKGDRFVFLLRRFNRKLNAWVYEQWSIHPFTKETLAKLRKLRKTDGR